MGAWGVLWAQTVTTGHCIDRRVSRLSSLISTRYNLAFPPMPIPTHHYQHNHGYLWKCNDSYRHYLTYNNRQYIYTISPRAATPLFVDWGSKETPKSSSICHRRISSFARKLSFPIRFRPPVEISRSSCGCRASVVVFAWHNRPGRYRGLERRNDRLIVSSDQPTMPTVDIIVCRLHFRDRVPVVDQWAQNDISRLVNRSRIADDTQMPLGSCQGYVQAAVFAQEADNACQISQLVWIYSSSLITLNLRCPRLDIRIKKVRLFLESLNFLIP